MITSTFESILDGSTIVGKRLTIFFNGKILSQTDFSAEAEMTEDSQNAFIAGKLSGVFA